MIFPLSGATVAAAGVTVAGTTNLQQDQPLIEVMLVLSIIGAVLTWAFLVYALWKFRDPSTKGRRYG